jgi:hypothetical protein
VLSASYAPWREEQDKCATMMYSTPLGRELHYGTLCIDVERRTAFSKQCPRRGDNSSSRDRHAQSRHLGANVLGRADCTWRPLWGAMTRGDSIYWLCLPGCIPFRGPRPGARRLSCGRCSGCVPCPRLARVSLRERTSASGRVHRCSLCFGCYLGIWLMYLRVAPASAWAGPRGLVDRSRPTSGRHRSNGYAWSLL